MWEYKREETQQGSYTPEQFFQLLNNYGKEGWEIVKYKEYLGAKSDYSFTVILKRKVLDIFK